MTIRIRRDTAANWTAANPVLSSGQPGFETNTGLIKIGDGVTAWNSLAYRFETSGGAAWGAITGTLSAQTDLNTALSGKQATLVSATNIKTINGSTILGAGDLAITASAAWGSITGTLSAQTDLNTALGLKANTSSLAAIAASGSAADLTAGTLPAARFDDTAHGARAGGTLHANVVAAGAAGFMSGADKTKLDGITGTNTGDQTITLTGDVTGTGTGSFAATLATVNSNVGSFGSATQVATFTVDGKGRTTAAGNATIAIASTAITDFNSATRAQVEAELIAGTNVTITPGSSGATRTLTIAASAGGGGSFDFGLNAAMARMTVY